MKAFTLLVLLCLFCAADHSKAQSARKNVQQGNALFDEAKYDEAGLHYQDALLADPESPVIHYNAGSVQYKKMDYEQALEYYRTALNSQDPLLQSRAYYNMGNSHYRQGSLQESIAMYEQALKLNPDDEDAKFNLEFVRNKIMENPDQQDQQDQQNQQDQQEGQDQQEQQPENDSGDDQDDGSPENDDQDQEDMPQPEQNEDQKEISRELAEQILDALNEDQEDKQKRRVQEQGRANVRRDW